MQKLKSQELKSCSEGALKSTVLNSTEFQMTAISPFFWILLWTLAGLLPLQFTGCNSKPAAPNSGTGKKITIKSQGSRKQDSTENSTKDNGPQLPDEFAFETRDETGIEFVHHSGIDEKRVFPAANGSGIGVVDFDRDGLEDLFFATGKDFPLTHSSTSVDHLYRNLGDWKFTACHSLAGLDHDTYSTGVAIGDFDNDGFQDIYIGCYGLNVMYRNQGDGSFRRMSADECPSGNPQRPPGLEKEIPDTPGWATSCAAFDYNNDGNLDLYVGNYGTWSIPLKNECGDRPTEPRFCSPTSVRSQPDVLYENNGDGTFTDVSKKAGIYTYKIGKNNQQVQVDYRTQGVIASDINHDGLMDLYCGNDMHPNLLLINSPEFVFQNRTELSSTGYGPNGGSKASMGVAAGDADNDGNLDLFCTNFSDEYNSFYKGMGDLQFSEVSTNNRISENARPWVGWGTEFIDFDADGWLDVIVTNGHVDPNIKHFESSEQHRQPPLIWKNEKGRFRLARVGGDYFSRQWVGRALARADLDLDGDEDLIIGHQDEPPALLENRTPIDPARMKSTRRILLIGTRSNRDGIGATIEMETSTGQVKRTHFAGGSYLASQTHWIRETRLDSGPAVVQWPVGKIKVALEDLKIVLVEPR